MSDDDDLFGAPPRGPADYDAHSIEVLEGLEPVRRRPGMYIGGIDERALHHLAAEVIDNSMDEAVAGHATRIEVTLEAEAGTAGRLTIADNGRGIPVDEHPRYPGKSALEVILTMLHSGGKFSDKAYATSGGLHGVGVSVVNALSSETIVEVARDRQLYRQSFARGLPTSKLVEMGATQNRRGTTLTFTPDPQIFGEEARLKPARLYRLARSKAYLFAGVEIRWRCDPALILDETPAEAVSVGLRHSPVQPHMGRHAFFGLISDNIILRSRFLAFKINLLPISFIEIQSDSNRRRSSASLARSATMPAHTPASCTPRASMRRKAAALSRARAEEKSDCHGFPQCTYTEHAPLDLQPTI